MFSRLRGQAVVGERHDAGTVDHCSTSQSQATEMMRSSNRQQPVQLARSRLCELELPRMQRNLGNLSFLSVCTFTRGFAVFSRLAQEKAVANCVIHYIKQSSDERRELLATCRQRVLPNGSSCSEGDEMRVVIVHRNVHQASIDHMKSAEFRGVRRGEVSGKYLCM